MRKVRMKSGGHVNIFSKGEAGIPGEINFSEKEWALAQKMGTSTNDPEAQKEFWKMLIEKKKADESYSLFTDFPEIGSEEPAAPTYTGTTSAVAAQENNSKRRAFKGEAICRETIEMLKGRGAKLRREREEDAS